MSITNHHVEKFRPQLQVVLKSKLEEFELLGYDTVSMDDLWDCLKNSTWRKMEDEPKLFQLVEDILSLTINDYMNYVRIEAFKSPNWQFGDSI
jgi:hypothetical protein